MILEDLAEVTDKETTIHGGAEGHKVRDGGAGDEDVAVLVGRVGAPLVPAGPRGLKGVGGLQLLPTSAGLQRGRNGDNVPSEHSLYLEKEHFRFEL